MKISIVLILSACFCLSLAGQTQIANQPEDVEAFLQSHGEGLASLVFYDPDVPNGAEIQQGF